MPIIPATGEVGIGGSHFEVSPGKKKKKLVRPYLKEQVGVWWLTSVISGTQEAEVGGSWSV
jgi:hypothetical protein